MLRELSIENLAVIEKASARFGGSFNVFTGETGAGKSILIGGINAILGHRTTKEIVRTGAKKAVITALFDELPSHVSEKLEELGFDFNEDELLLTREIFADGKSNARINGRPATAAMLKEIGSLLVDVHGQHENRILMSNDNQRDILDNYGEITGKLAPYREKFREFAKVSKRLKTLQEELKTRELKIGHLTAVVEELSALGLEKGDGESLEQELERVRGTAKIQTAVWTAYNALNSENGGSVSDLLQKALETLRNVEFAEPKVKKLADRIAALIPETDDIAGELFSLTADDYEEREAAISDKVSAIKHAKRKYNRDADDLIDYLDECKNELATLSNADDEIEKLTEQRRELAEEVRVLADEISDLRKKAAEALSDEICEQLKFLDMPNVRILFAIEPDKITINGRDSVEMLISANAGEEPRPLTKIASGGELSRIMLAIKSVLADADDIPTLIFDEVDAGISGRAAQKVGVKLRETAAKRQVLCITHLAQIAAKAELHLLIEKETDNERTFTRITELDQEGRVRELARIIDGTESESALETAREMLTNK
ncbi:MAG: DNA repair protein RecN [Oscillospiraceae bacterium]|nr:DNA repair protein RecN [Oscillospiraceae bacterium]